MRTSLPRSLTSAASRSTLLRSIIASPSLLVPLGMRISERRAFLKRVGRSAQHRCQLRGAHPCMPYHALSNAPGGSTASESIAPAMIAPVFRLPRSGVSPAHLALHGCVLLCARDARLRIRRLRSAGGCVSGQALLGHRRAPWLEGHPAQAFVRCSAASWRAFAFCSRVIAPGWSTPGHGVSSSKRRASERAWHGVALVGGEGDHRPRAAVDALAGRWW